jgi:PAS domain S-box-containing protein
VAAFCRTRHEGQLAVDFARYFEYLTTGTYLALITIWALIVLLYAVEFRRIQGFSPLLKTLLIVLFIDAGRTLFESLYFGTWYTAKANLIDPRIFTVLSRPELFVIPKAMNLIGAVVILTVLCRRWIHDMVAEETKQQETQRLEAFQKAAFNAITDPVAVLDTEFRILMANDATAELYGLSREQIVGGRCSALLHGSHELCEACPVATVIETGKPAYAEVLATSINEVLATSAYPLKDAEGRVTGVIKYAKVVTEQKKLEDQRRAVEQFRNELISLASHEIRAPLTSIRGYAETLTNGAANLDPEEFREFVQIIDHESQRLETLVTDLLDMSQVDEGKLRLDPGPCALAPVCEEAIRVTVGASSRHDVKSHVPPDLPQIRASRERVRQILVNLLSNATKYSPDGGTVTLTAGTVGGVVRVSVSDEGIGIPEDAQERLFTRFYRVRAPETADVQGTGLGLYICKVIVEGYGGRLWAESRPGDGSTFHVELPAGDAPPAG